MNKSVRALFFQGCSHLLVLAISHFYTPAIFLPFLSLFPGARAEGATCLVEATRRTADGLSHCKKVKAKRSKVPVEAARGASDSLLKPQ